MRTILLWLRGAVFTILVPGVVAGYVPYWLAARGPTRGGIWLLGWGLVAAGAALYLWCVTRFLLAGGTPSIHFTRPLRFLIGTAPPGLVRQGPYRFSRNPMYLSVVTMIFGQAILSASWQAIVMFVEEPHLRARDGAGYDEYCRRTPRWIGFRPGK